MCCNKHYGISNQNGNIRFDANLDTYTEEAGRAGYAVIRTHEDAYISMDSSDGTWLSEHCTEWIARGGRVTVVDDKGDETPLGNTAPDARTPSSEIRIYGDAVLVNTEGVKVLAIRHTDSGEIDACMPRLVAESVDFEEDRRRLQEVRNRAGAESIDRQITSGLGDKNGYKVETVSRTESGDGTEGFEITRTIRFNRRSTAD